MWVKTNQIILLCDLCVSVAKNEGVVRVSSVFSKNIKNKGGLGSLVLRVLCGKKWGGSKKWVDIYFKRVTVCSNN